jgi:hypothetical protein
MFPSWNEKRINSDCKFNLFMKGNMTTEYTFEDLKNAMHGPKIFNSFLNSDDREMQSTVTSKMSSKKQIEIRATTKTARGREGGMSKKTGGREIIDGPIEKTLKNFAGHSSPESRSKHFRTGQDSLNINLNAYRTETGINSYVGVSKKTTKKRKNTQLSPVKDFFASDKITESGERTTSCHGRTVKELPKQAEEPQKNSNKRLKIDDSLNTLVVLSSSHEKPDTASLTKETSNTFSEEPDPINIMKRDELELELRRRLESTYPKLKRLKNLISQYLVNSKKGEINCNDCRDYYAMRRVGATFSAGHDGLNKILEHILPPMNSLCRYQRGLSCKAAHSNTE